LSVWYGKIELTLDGVKGDRVLKAQANSFLALGSRLPPLHSLQPVQMKEAVQPSSLDTELFNTVTVAPSYARGRA
jgi:hypothetical protein